MENRKVGYIILGISVLIILVIFMFNNALTNIVDATCSAEHGPSCPMYMAIDQQTYLALGIVGLLAVIGLVLIFSKPEEKLIVKKVKEKVKRKKVDTKGWRKEDKQAFKIVQKEGSIFQADLIDKTGFGKAKMSRVLDRLENKGAIERKRRGMTNVVVLKDK